MLYLPICSISASLLCPVTNCLHLCILVAALPTSPAFVYQQEHSIVPLVYSIFVNQLRYWLKLIHVSNVKLYSSHSLRRGGATWAFQCGVSPDLIKLQGDWQSNAYLRYIHVSLARKFSTSQKMAQCISQL
jgi:hypothetical protein